MNALNHTLAIFILVELWVVNSKSWYVYCIRLIQVLYVHQLIGVLQNQHLLKDLIERGLWNDNIKNMIIAHNGSVQQVPDIPDDLKKLYKTVWELSQRVIIDMAADRGAFVDQSQSLNLFMAEPTNGKLTSMHFYSWQKGLKTGMYYLRSRPAVDAIKVYIKEGMPCPFFLMLANPTFQLVVHGWPKCTQKS